MVEKKANDAKRSKYQKPQARDLSDFALATGLVPLGTCNPTGSYVDPCTDGSVAGWPCSGGGVPAVSSAGECTTPGTVA